MPRRRKPTKDVVGCDKPRGGVKQPSIRGFPNGETHMVKNHVPYTEVHFTCVVLLGMGREPVELKHLSKPRNRNYSLSSGERKGISPNLALVLGVVGPVKISESIAESSGKLSDTR